jgi:hypothetical protein
MPASQRSATPLPGLRPRTAALIVTVAIAVVLALTIMLSIAGGGDGDERAPVQVVPSAPLPPSPAERDQPPGQWGPGMRP